MCPATPPPGSMLGDHLDDSTSWNMKPWSGNVPPSSTAWKTVFWVFGFRELSWAICGKLMSEFLVYRFYNQLPSLKLTVRTRKWAGPQRKLAFPFSGAMLVLGRVCHPTQSPTGFRYLKWRIPWTLSFWGLGETPYISRIHTVYIGESFSILSTWKCLVTPRFPQFFGLPPTVCERPWTSEGESFSMMFGSENRSEEEEQETMFSLVGGFNPFEKYSSNWIISSGRGENKNIWNHHLVCFSGRRNMISNRLFAFPSQVGILPTAQSFSMALRRLLP